MTKPNTDVEQAKHTIAMAAEDATRTIAAAAAAAANSKSGSDHDLIIRLDTKMDGLSDQITKLDSGTSARITNLENEKLNINDSYPMLYKKRVDDNFLDHETRIRSNEINITRILTWGSILLVLLGVAEFFVAKLLIH